MNNIINPDGTVQYDKPFDGYSKDFNVYGKSAMPPPPLANPEKTNWKGKKSAGPDKYPRLKK